MIFSYSSNNLFLLAAYLNLLRKRIPKGSPREIKSLILISKLIIAQGKRVKEQRLNT